MTLHHPLRPASFSKSAPKHRDARVADALATYEQGDIEGALAMVVALLDADPDWIEGYRTAAELLWQCGTPEAFRTWLSEAVRRGAGRAEVAATCLRMLSDAGFHETVEALLPTVRIWAGEHLFFTMLGAVAASERGDVARADALFSRGDEQGGRLSLPHVHHMLRTGRAADAAILAEQIVAQQPDNQTGWGLLATAWRLTGDARHDWLVNRPGLVRVIDMDVEPTALDALARRLRSLHVARTHPFDMSVRGGTQTGGKILDRQEPEIAALRLGFMSALHRYAAGLPAEDMRHPLLARKRDAFTLSDSWSVRLLGGGYHVSHIHPVGTLSAAFYVALPETCAESPNAGWLTIGAPPEELATGLAPLQLIEPKLGRLVLFPSFHWHGTLPFPKGERITVAFDTILPGI
ncbi:hypothetical protein BH10PSE13_BH10PSE13_07560 [soil metagenome]